MNPLLSYTDYSVFFGNKEVVKNLSCDIMPGQTLGIVGESGSGKSVSCLSAIGLLPSSSGAQLQGQVHFQSPTHGKVDMLSADNRLLSGIRGKEISVIFQEPMTSLNPVLRCGYQVDEVMMHHEGISQSEAQKRTLDLFDMVKLPRAKELYRAYPHQLSGGQKQRVMIAMALACKPALLIADEPTTALDVTVQQSVLDLLKELRTHTGMSMIFISHDLAVVAGMADILMVMYKGQAVEQGRCHEVLTTPQHPYTQALLNCRPGPDSKGKRLKVVNDFLNADKPLTNSTPTLNDAPEPAAKTGGEKLLEVNEHKVEFTGGYTLMLKKKPAFVAVDNFTFDIRRGETLGLVGESGCGKTSLIRSLIGLLPVAGGTVNYAGDVVSTKNGHLHSKLMQQKVRMVFQDPYASLNPIHTIGYAITEPMAVYGLHGNAAGRKLKALELLHTVGLDAAAYNKYPHQFSGGQRQRICIARALSTGPELLICDESVSALDASVQAVILNLLNDLKKQKALTMLFISHDLAVVRYMSDRIMVMNKGKMEEFDDAEKIYHNPASAYTRRLIEATPGL